MAFVDYFPSQAALDGDTGVVMKGVSAQVFALSDTGYTTPLTVTDLQGIPIGTSIVSSSQGWYPLFRVPGHTQVVAVSGGNPTYLTSIYGFILAVLPDPSEVDDGMVVKTQGGEFILTPSAESLLPDLGAGQPGYALVVNSAGDGFTLEPIVGTGGPTSWDQVTNKPALAPASHTQPLASLRRSDDTTLATVVLTLLTAGDAQAARAAIGAGTGNGNSNLALGSGSTQAMPGDRQFASQEISFAPATGSPLIGTSTVREALEKAATLGGNSGVATQAGSRWVGGQYTALPTTKPTGILSWPFIGPVVPTVANTVGGFPAWLGNGPTQIPGEIKLNEKMT